MLSGYQRVTLQGLGCGIEPCAKCSGMGDLLDPSTWGPSDWLVAISAVWIGYKMLMGGKQELYNRKIVRRLEQS
jgi:hypothetical protein